MKVYNYINLTEFKPWAGAEGTYYRLSPTELYELDDMLSKIFLDGLTETELNDLFWFDDDWLLDLLEINKSKFWDRPKRLRND